jgi:FAD dependent oxidoreductase
MTSYNFDKFTPKEIVGMYKEPAKEIPIVAKTQVLVVGGSQSGTTAAIAAARLGMKVQLVERFGFLGGQSVFSMVVQWEKRAFINNLGAVCTKGIPKEMLDNIIAKGGSDELWNTPPGCPEMRDGEEWVNPEAIKITMIEMCEKEGIDLLFHTIAVDAMVDRQPGKLPKLTGVIFENKTGRFAIQADIIIDATADLDIVWRAIGEEGCGLREPRDRIGSGFYTWYAGIDNEKYIDWYINTAENIGGYPSKPDNIEKIKLHLKENKLIIVPGSAYNDIFAKADELDLMEPIENILEELEIMGFITIGAKWVGNDRWCCYFTGINNLNMLDSFTLTKFEIFRQKLAVYMLPIMRLIPGWENTYISRESSYMGSRETRWLKAKTMITQDLI